MAELLTDPDWPQTTVKTRHEQRDSINPPVYETLAAAMHRKPTGRLPTRTGGPRRPGHRRNRGCTAGSAAPARNQWSGRAQRDAEPARCQFGRGCQVPRISPRRSWICTPPSSLFVGSVMIIKRGRRV
ncbi:hypothetical protein [Micromonospora orduensis]|uniref:hypothetical protein n=1 Tax=Micromonospora orduensis TaxID=1420891 RepID=UPI001117D8F2|nr:hypothetical protein [Micromonospora orduensis]